MKSGVVIDMYDNIGNLQQVPGFATYSGYNALGQVGSVTYDNGIATTYSYYSPTDHPGWLNRLKSIKTGPSYSLQNLTYTYYNNGNIYTITDANDANRSQTFTYDHLDRLTQAQSSVYGTITYSYDQIGNMTYNSQVGNYYYNASRPHAVYQAGSSTYGYDNNGNMTSAPGKTLTYNYDNMPSSINGLTFVYDYSGHRVKKNSTIYIGKLYECAGSSCTKYIFAGSNRIALKTSISTYYYHTDHLGSSNVMTDTYGTSQGNYHYYPYGATRISSGLSIKHKFTGQELDSETGLYYYGARYYDPALGRFVSADSIVQDSSDPQTLNRYSYCRNNPIILTDPTGHFIFGEFLKSFASGFVGGAVFVLTGGSGAPITAGIWAGMAAGGTSAALHGGDVGQILQGAVLGGALGGIGGGIYSTFGATGVYATLAGGAAYATATSGLNGLAYYGGGIIGGALGAVGVSDLTAPELTPGQAAEDDPLSFDGKRLTATDAEGNVIDSWKASSGRPGTTFADQWRKDIGPIPEGDYSVNPGKIERWHDLPILKRIAADFGLTNTWKGGPPAWGHYRVPIDIPGGSILGRGTFFIHGGWTPGSAGCIDVGFGDVSFFNYLSSQRGSMPLTVKYGY
jgi:RHS repeat-associated protein